MSEKMNWVFIELSQISPLSGVNMIIAMTTVFLRKVDQRCEFPQMIIAIEVRKTMREEIVVIRGAYTNGNNFAAITHEKLGQKE